MDAAVPPAWHGYALTGRPDFLNYLRRGDVSWSDLWRFYRETPAEADVMTRLIGLFHAFLSVEYDREGCVLDADNRVYPQLHEWARFAVECREYLPEEKLRDSLAGLLAQSLVSAHYYEAVFNVYLEAYLEQQRERWMTEVPHKLPEEAPLSRRLAVRLSDLPHWQILAATPGLRQAAESVVDGHYPGWNRAYVLALGEDEDDGDWLDEGGGA